MEAEGALHIEGAVVQPGYGFIVKTAQLVVAPAGHGEAVGVGCAELQLDLARDGKGFVSFGQFLLEPFVQVVVVWVILVFKWIERVVIVQTIGADENAVACAKIADAGQVDGIGKGERGGTDPPGDGLAIALG